MRFYQLTFYWILLLCMAGCRKEAFDEYYGRPEWLESAIYTKLQEQGNFSAILQLIDKAGYTATLNEAGYWTFFAPNDDAFQRFLTEQNIGSVEEISNEMAEQIVRYALVYNAFKTDRLSDYQSSLGWVDGMAFRRRTAYYDGFQTETVRINGVERTVTVTASNRNNVAVNFGTPYYVDGDNNNKYITYLHEEYATLNGVTAEDYSFFYPNASWAGFNVFGAQVDQADIIAENGVIHEVNEVNLPKLSLDQYLATADDYSYFRDSILNAFFVTYQYNEEASKTYEYRTGEVGEVFVKVYDPMLSFSPNNENFMKAEDNDGQQDGYSMFVPKNDVLVPWVNEVLLEHYGTLARVPKSVMADFVNAMMWQSAVWPSQFETKPNTHEELLRLDEDGSDHSSYIADRQMLSNGFFYGTDRLHQSNLFNTVYKHVILDPDYSLMLMLLGAEYRNLIINPDKNFTVFLFSDRLLGQLGYVYNERLSQWTWIDRNNNTIGHSIVEPRLQRILYSHIVETPNDELANIANTRGYIQTGDRVIPGEYIKWNNGEIYAAGNELLGLPMKIVGEARFGNNGRVYYVDNLLEFSGETIGQAVKRVVESNDNLTKFRDYLFNSTLFNGPDSTLSVMSAGGTYTFLIPNNTAIDQAIADGLLPATTTPSELPEQASVERFIQYHILANINIAADGNPDITSAVTLLKDDNDQNINVQVANSVGNLRFVDHSNRTVPALDNVDLYISNRIVLHELDGYLNYMD